MDTLTPELKQAVEQAGDSPVRLTDPETHRAYVLVSAEVFDRLLLDDERPARAGRVSAGREEERQGPPDGGRMISRGEIYLADFDEMEPHPVVVVSREELNRGNWVAAVLITSKAVRGTIEATALRPIPKPGSSG